MKLEITIHQLKNYLGTGVIVRTMDYKIDYVGKEFDKMIGLHQWDKSGKLWSVLLEGGSKPSPSSIHPVCFRLSDLDKFIPELGFVPIEELLKIATEMIWGGKIEPTGVPEVLTEGESTGIIAWNDTERVSFTFNKEDNWFDFQLCVDGSEMKLDKFHLFQKLFEWHFWAFDQDYFDKGLIIDKLNHGK